MSETQTNKAPSFREVLLHLHAVSTLDFSQRPSSEFPCGYGTAMLYGLVIRTMTDDGQNLLDQQERERRLAGGRWLGLHDKAVLTTFDDQPCCPPNNGREIVSLFRQCVELDPLFLACFDPLAVNFILKHDPLVGSFRCLVPLALPPAWLFDEHRPWTKMIAAGAKMAQLANTPECNNETTENAMWRGVLEEMLDKYEPRA